MEHPAFWDDPDGAQKIIKKGAILKSWLVPYKEMQEQLLQVKDLWPDAEAMGDEAFLQELIDQLDVLEEKIAQMEIKKMLSGEMDAQGCFCSINAGAGGTESCDWVSMLARMYQRWAVRKGWKVEVIDKLDGEVAGIKNITMRFEGDFAYGYCKSEKGVHRLVRISPFDSGGRRHTSFASVDIIPIVDDAVEVEIRPDDLRVDTFRSSGAGGQHVNTTDSAVRIVHLPTGITVSCQSERSQVQNRETCMKMLKSKLYETEVMKREDALSKMGGEKKDIGWGSQIRSYTFQPYSLVKDTRTKFETGNVAAVMDGDLEGFVCAYLKEFG